jgi:hypothetical protein
MASADFSLSKCLTFGLVSQLMVTTMNHTSKNSIFQGADIGMNTRTIKHTLTDDGWK